MTAIQFRHCLASDIDAALPLIISSGPEAFAYVFIDRSPAQLEAFLRRAFVASGNEFSAECHLALTDKGEIVALGALRYAEQTPAFSLRAMAQILCHYQPLAAARTAWRGLRTETIIKPPPKGVAFIYQLAVRPDRQGRGHGRQLIAELLRRAQQQGYRRAGLNVSVDNPRAQALYEQLGFRVLRQTNSALRSNFGYVPGQRYMELALAANT